MRKVYALIITIFFLSVSYAQTTHYWSGNSSVSDNIDQASNWYNGNPASGDNLYFNNTGNRHWAYSNYAAGSWFNELITYSGAGGIKFYGDNSYFNKIENNNDPNLLELNNSTIGNRGGNDMEINPVGGPVFLSGLILSLDLNNGGNKTLNIWGSNTITIRNVITEYNNANGHFNLFIHNAPTVNLNGANNVWKGTTTIGGGNLNLGAKNALPVGGGTINFTGASTLNTNGYGQGTSATPVGALDFDANTIINLRNWSVNPPAGPGEEPSVSTSDLYFADSRALTWSATTITINNWKGTSGSSGTATRIFVGNGASALTTAQLRKIKFTGYNGSATLLSSGELVPFCNSTISLISAAATANQGNVVGSPIAEIVYQAPNSTESDISVTGLPPGVSYSFESASSYIRINGNPSTAPAPGTYNTYKYYVRSTLACNVDSGIIMVTNLSNTNGAHYFRSKQSGYWSHPTTWEWTTDSINGTWTAAQAFPDSVALSTTIQSTHLITKSTDLYLFPKLSTSHNYLHILNGGNLDISLIQALGFDIRGNIVNDGTLNLTPSSVKPFKVVNMVNNGSLTLSSNSTSEDLRVLGNFVQNGIFNPNMQAVNFIGSGNQTISGTVSPIKFTYLRLIKTGGVVTALNDIQALGSPTYNSSYPAALRVSNAIFNIQGRTLQIAAPGEVSTVNCAEGGVLRTDKDSRILILGIKSASQGTTQGNIDFESGSKIGTLIVDRQNGDVKTTTSFTVADSLFIKEGLFDSHTVSITLDTAAVGILLKDTLKSPSLSVDYLIFNKTETESAQFYKNNRTLSIASGVKTNLYFKQTNKWHFVSFPYTISNVYKPDNSPAGRGTDFSIAQYNPVKRASGVPGWETSNDNPIEAGKGYIINEITDNGYLTFVGTAAGDNAMFNDNASKTLIYTQTTTSGDINNYNSGWNFIAHPLSMVATPTLTDGQFAYNYNPSVDTYSVWYNQPNPAYTYGSSGVQPMESYFVKVPSTSQQVTWGMTTQMGLRQFSKAALAPVIQLALHANNIQYPTYIRVRTDATAQFDQMLDAPYNPPMYSGTPRTYTFAGTSKAALNSVPDNTEIAVGVRFPAQGDYSFSWIMPVEIAAATLTDKQTGTVTDMTTVNSYNFNTAVTGDMNTRFVLNIGPKIPTRVSKTDLGYSVYGLNKQIFLEGINENSMVQILDLSGRTVIHRNVSIGKSALNISNSGVYLVKISNSKGENTVKVILK